VYSAGSLIAGAKVHYLPLLEKNGFLPALENIPHDVLKAAKILWLNYPNNPTGAIASLEFFERTIDFGKKHHILIAHDAPYTDVCFNGYKAPSILEVRGAKEISIEFNSLSKTYNMAGWRLGMAIGNADVIKYLHTYKSQMDSSHFAPIIEAGIAALSGDQSWLERRNNIYQRRRDIVVNGLREAGFKVSPPLQQSMSGLDCRKGSRVVWNFATECSPRQVSAQHQELFMVILVRVIFAYL